MSIHQRIRERRLALGMESHKALADAVGVAWQTVQLWEKEIGGTAPNRNRIEKVAKVLGVSTTWLVSGPQSDDDRSNDPQRAAEKQPAFYAWISPEEGKLLTLYRTTDDRGRAAIMEEAEKSPRVLLPGIVRNEA